MDLSRLIKRVEKYLSRDLQFSMREFKQLQELKADILKIEELLRSGSSNSAVLIEHYKDKSKHDLAYVERIGRRLNVWIKRLENLILEEETKISPRDKQYFELFKQRIDVCKNNLIRILAWGGELHRMINEPKFVPDTQKIKAKIDEAFGDDRRPGLKSLVELFQQFGKIEEHLNQIDLEEYLYNLRKITNRMEYAQLIKTPEYQKLLAERTELNRISLERKIAENRFLSERVKYFCLIISKQFGLGVPQEAFPNAHIDWNLSSEAQYSKDYGMVFKSNSYINEGTAVGEEIGHFFREFLRPKLDNNEVLTHEFFGFLGRRLLYKLVPSIFQLEPSIGYTRLDVLSQKINRFKQKRKELGLNPAYLNNDYASYLKHYRGYDFASRLDLSKIHNWRKLFSMPNREVRMRFFRLDPDYSGL